jgi:hypothetical protein
MTMVNPGATTLTAVVFYLALSVFFIVDPLRHMGVPARRPAGRNISAGG